jgi:hypothetical protein
LLEVPKSLLRLQEEVLELRLEKILFRNGGMNLLLPD